MSVAAPVVPTKEDGEVDQERSLTNFSKQLQYTEFCFFNLNYVLTSAPDAYMSRLVAMLAELGQKGGLLKLVGKVALLWGGLRGAMSFTDKLISFLRIAERPLLQR